MKFYKDQCLKDVEHLKNEVLRENVSQIIKWGVQTHSLFEWGNYLAEEVGEVAKAIAELEYRNGTKEELYKEAIQVATLALKLAEMVKYGYEADVPVSSEAKR